MYKTIYQRDKIQEVVKDYSEQSKKNFIESCVKGFREGITGIVFDVPIDKIHGWQELESEVEDVN